MKLHTLLHYGGNCAEAFHFYEEHLGGKITFLMTYAQMPNPETVPPGMENAVLHASIELGGTKILADDAPAEQFQPIEGAFLTLSVDSDAEAERIYNLLSDSGKAILPIQETFFATRFSMLRDKFGALWMIIHERPMPA